MQSNESYSNLKIQDGTRPPSWIFVFAIHSLNCSKSNTEEITLNLVNLSTKNERYWQIKNLRNSNHVGFLKFATYSLGCQQSNTDEKKTNLAILAATEWKILTI